MFACPNCYNSQYGKVYFLYFVSFFLFASLVFLNLFVAIIIEAFNDTANDTGDSRILPDHFNHFIEVWGMVDPEGTPLLFSLSLSSLLFSSLSLSTVCLSVVSTNGRPPPPAPLYIYILHPYIYIYAFPSLQTD